jgi:hypothetical protein
MGAIRIEAFRELAARIEAAVPDLAGKVTIGQAPSDTEPTYPTLIIVPGLLKYEPAQELEHATIGDAADGVVVFNVGSHAGPVQLRILATTVEERYTLEQQVLDMFLAEELRPGVVIVSVTTCPELGDWLAAFALDTDQWIDSATVEQLESSIMVNTTIPALVTRTAVYEASELVLGTTADFATAFDTDTMAAPAVEIVAIDEDGTITPYPPPI